LNKERRLYLNYNKVNLNLLASYNLITTTNTPFIDLGLFGSKKLNKKYVDDDKVMNFNISDVQDNQFGIVLGLGYNIKIAKHLDLLIELRRYQTLNESDTNISLGFNF
jgi:hypothetical protein